MLERRPLGPQVSRPRPSSRPRCAERLERVARVVRAPAQPLRAREADPDAHKLFLVLVPGARDELRGPAVERVELRRGGGGRGGGAGGGRRRRRGQCDACGRRSRGIGRALFLKGEQSVPRLWAGRRSFDRSDELAAVAHLRVALAETLPRRSGALGVARGVGGGGGALGVRVARGRVRVALGRVGVEVDGPGHCGGWVWGVSVVAERSSAGCLSPLSVQIPEPSSVALGPPRLGRALAFACLVARDRDACVLCRLAPS